MGEKICAVILNYNDAGTTLGLVRELMDSRLLSDLVVVDNASTDASWEVLCAFREENGPKSRLHLLQSGKNGGYGYGNQLGITYARECLGAAYILVANPDIHVTDGCIGRLYEALSADKDAALASARVKGVRGERLFCYWDLVGFWKDLFDTEPILRRVLRPWLLTRPGKLSRGTDDRSVVVGAVPGSLFLLKCSALAPALSENLFDPGIFLYYEEKVLAQKLRGQGLHILLVTDVFYVHAHGTSIKKSYADLTGRQCLLHQSKLYYYEKYLGISGVRLMFARLFLRLVLVEVTAAERVLAFLGFFRKEKASFG